ncbi:ATP-dependent helicase [Hyphomicrobium sp.]|uniref:UvrD-helicase domain-containing protein n=1 Tax=Hyphomicrobium sp. TaxID=82 RepID=UPI001D3858E0|nr:ATP-dependent helicase [Hyphomicrobium sp.]MBY0558587.1 ATP-dependent helicase [Hyphomicrobium sp.]
MNSKRRLQACLQSLEKNKEQAAAARMKTNAVVLAGPGSGKTKTLTTAMARTLIEDVEEPRGVACITYNNECAYELEDRLNALGIERDDRTFIGTLHSFALTQIILPYGRCVLPDWVNGLSVATEEERAEAIAIAHANTIGGNDDPKKRWEFASDKRKRIIDREAPDWRGRNPELADFIEAYEAELRSRKKIDFDDMPLLAYDMVAHHAWIRDSIRAKYPVLFIDEYQDLGRALHLLVLKLCFESGIRLFAVGDADQSIYGFNGAEPSLLDELSMRADVSTIQLKFNYRCGTRIIRASMAALGEERDYKGPDGAHQGLISFHPIKGGRAAQATFVLNTLVSQLQDAGYSLNEIGVLYRWAKHGKDLVELAEAKGIPFVRADNQALIKRNSPVARFVERCARWAIGGWRLADPKFAHLLREATSLVFGTTAKEQERKQLESELVKFLKPVDPQSPVHDWLRQFRDEVVAPWSARARTIGENWTDLDEMIERTTPNGKGSALGMGVFCGDTSGSGALNLSTFHSAKGREFRAVILLEMNDDVIPNHKSRSNKMRRFKAICLNLSTASLPLRSPPDAQKHHVAGAARPTRRRLSDRLSSRERRTARRRDRSALSRRDR